MSAEADPTRVLIVDGDGDEAVLLEACLRDGLEEPGLVVRHVASTAAARDEIEAAPYDVLLLSLRAGDEGAFPFLASLRERSAPIPAVVLTGRTNADSAVRALRAGAFEVLVKPSLTPASLAATVRYAVQLEESRRKETAAEQALRRAERQAEALVASSLDIVSIIDADGVIRFSSPSVERLLGYPPEKVDRARRLRDDPLCRRRDGRRGVPPVHRGPGGGDRGRVRRPARRRVGAASRVSRHESPRGPRRRRDRRDLAGRHRAAPRRGRAPTALGRGRAGRQHHLPHGPGRDHHLRQPVVHARLRLQPRGGRRRQPAAPQERPAQRRLLPGTLGAPSRPGGPSARRSSTVPGTAGSSSSGSRSARSATGTGPSPGSSLSRTTSRTGA